MINNTKTPVFSVVIPTCNRAQLLPRAVQSVLNQTFQDYELIIIDDASTDDTQNVVETFQNERIVYIRRGQNGGNAAARNAGVTNAKGAFVSFLDDDDEYLPRFLEETHQAFEKASEQTGFTWCGATLVKDTPEGETELGNELWQPQFRDREQAYLSFLHFRRIGTDRGLTVRKSCFDSVGLFDETLRKAVDTDFLIRLVRHYDFVAIPHTLIKLHDHSGPRVRHSAQGGATAYERIIQKNLMALQAHPSIWAKLLYKTGWLHYHAGNKSRGRKFMLESVRRNPFQTKTWLSLILFEFFGSMAPQLHQRISLSKSMLFQAVHLQKR